MPHCVLEYSANVVDRVDAPAVFQRLHQSLAEIEAFTLHDIKSRAICHTDYFVGDGAPPNCFVYLRFSLLSGRDISVRQRVVQTCLKVLAEAFAKTLAERACQLSVEVVEMDRSAYAKYSPDSDSASV
jgi:5-carboxymethyl-2-hydroxymuconate isomerase